MKNKNDLVRFSVGKEDDFDNMFNYYQQLQKERKILEEKKKYYDELICEDGYSYSYVTDFADDNLYNAHLVYSYKKNKRSFKNMDFRNQLRLYNIIDSFDDDEVRFAFFQHGVSLYLLQRKMLDEFPELDEYVGINHRLYTIEQLMRDISFRTNFRAFEKKQSHEFCETTNDHFFTYIDNELKCIFCGATSKDYDLSDDETKFLADMASRQKLLLEGATKDDVPYIDFMKNKKTYYTRNIEDQDSYLQKLLDSAHKFDEEGQQKDKIDMPYYFPRNEIKARIDNVKREMKEIELMNIDSLNKDILLEICKSSYYELLLISGKSPIQIYKELDNEDDRIAFVKAYYHLLGWWQTEYNYYSTADKDINQKILDIKINR